MAKKVLKTDPKKVTRSINDIIADKFNMIKKRFSLNLDSVFHKSYSRAQLDGISAKPSVKAKKIIVKNRVNALKSVMLQDIDNIQNKTSQDAARDVANNYATGASSGSLKQQIKNNFNMTDSKVSTVVRTNTAYLASLTKLKVWQEQGFSHYLWITGKFDSKTRPQHKKWNHKEFSIADALAGKAPIPGHVMENGKINLSQSINCRCGVRLSR